MFYIGILAFAIWRLYKDFNKTQGYVFQKIQHVFFIFILFSSNIWSFQNFFRFIRSYHTYLDWNITAQLSYIPNIIGFVLDVSSSLTGMVIYVLSFALLARADFARKIVLWVIPFHILVRLPVAHYVYLFEFDTENGAMKFWVGVSFLAIYAIIFFAYNGKKMKQFFHVGKSETTKNLLS